MTAQSWVWHKRCRRNQTQRRYKVYGHSRLSPLIRAGAFSTWKARTLLRRSSASFFLRSSCSTLRQYRTAPSGRVAC
eukprot:3630866-Rhodomonas_salina.2